MTRLSFPVATVLALAGCVAAGPDASGDATLYAALSDKRLTLSPVEPPGPEEPASSILDLRADGTARVTAVSAGGSTGVYETTWFVADGNLCVAAPGSDVSDCPVTEFLGGTISLREPRPDGSDYITTGTVTPIPG